MINMIKADLYRIFRGIGIYAALAVMILMISLSIYSVSPGSVGQAYIGDISTTDLMDQAPLDDMTYEEIQEMSAREYREAMLKSEGYALDRDILGYNMNLYYVFIFIAALAVTTDFSGGSVKNTLSSAISRKKYFFSKLIFIVGGCLILFFLNTYISYFANIIFNGKNLSSSLWTVTRISLLQLPPILALVSILVGFAFTVKKTALYNMITIPFVLVFQLLFNIAVKIFSIKEKYIYYELQLMLGKLANNPSDSYLMHSYLLCGGIIIVFTLISYFSFKRAEIG